MASGYNDSKTMKFHKTTCSGDEFLELAERSRRKEIVVYGWRVGKTPAEWIVDWSEPDKVVTIFD